MWRIFFSWKSRTNNQNRRVMYTIERLLLKKGDKVLLTNFPEKYVPILPNEYFPFYKNRRSLYQKAPVLRYNNLKNLFQLLYFVKG